MLNHRCSNRMLKLCGTKLSDCVGECYFGRPTSLVQAAVCGLLGNSVGLLILNDPPSLLDEVAGSDPKVISPLSLLGCISWLVSHLAGVSFCVSKNKFLGAVCLGAV